MPSQDQCLPALPPEPFRSMWQTSLHSGISEPRAEGPWGPTCWLVTFVAHKLGCTCIEQAVRRPHGIYRAWLRCHNSKGHCPRVPDRSLSDTLCFLIGGFSITHIPNITSLCMHGNKIPANSYLHLCLFLQLESLGQSELASRLTLNCQNSYVEPHKIRDIPVTIMDVSFSWNNTGTCHYKYIAKI